MVGLFSLLPTGSVRGEVVSVDDCVRLALARAPAARAAGFEVDAAAARVRGARAAYAPRLLAEGEYGRSEGFDTTVTNGGSTVAVLTVETTLLDGGLRDAQLAAAQARLRSATALAQQRRADVALAVRTAYFAAVAARTEADVQEDRLRTVRSYVGLLQRQEQLGLVPHNDTLRAQLEGNAAQTARRAALAELATRQAELAALTGAELASAALGEPAATPLVEAAPEAIELSPVIADARVAVDAARRDADAARSAWRGQVTFSANGGALGVYPRQTFENDAGGQFLLGVRVPLYDGGAAAAQVAAAAAQANSAEAGLAEARQTIRIALARAQTEARRAQGDLADWQEALPRAAEHLALMRARYLGGGNVRLLEVLDAMNQHVDARLNATHALLAYRVAIATAQQILGTVFS